MKADVYNQKSEQVGTVELPDAVFGVKWNPALVHQVVTSQMANRRQPLAHTKTRGEVRGGGRKPWRQKHTGRSRHGSSRSPLWPGGGITFGPRNDRDFTRRIPVAMKRAALRTVLSKKLAEKEVRVIDTFTLSTPKTKQVAALVRSFFGKPTSVLFVSGKKSAAAFARAGRNLPKTAVLHTPSLNVYDCLLYRYIIFEQNAISEVAAKKQ